MKKLLPLIFISWFSIHVSAQCITNVNFNTWVQGGQPANGNWSVQGGGSTVYQSVNGNPTFYLSPNDLINVHVTGNFRSIDTDNDWMGFVFSYDNPMGATDSFDMWLFDWKQEQQGGASSGKSLCRVNGVIPPGNYTPTFWDHQNSPEFTVIQNSFGSAGWNTGTNHAFELYLTYTRAQIYVDGVLTFDRQDCFKPGRFGFLHYSQSDCIYSNFQYDLFVDFTLPQKICIGDTTSIVFASPCASGTVDYQSATWNFGDGTVIPISNPTLNNINVSHVYTTPGTYTVTLTVVDLGGCTAVKTRTIQVGAPIAITPSITQPLCNGGSNGGITVSSTGGFGNYSYNWSNGTVGPVLVGATAGNYSVSVTDGFCSASGIYTVNQPPPLAASVSTTDASCNQNNGTATISITGGTPPYQGVNWAGIAGYTATGLAPGFYIADFTDFNGCSATLQYQGGSSVLQYTATIGSLPCGYTLSASATNQICGNVNDGTATVTVTGGVPPINITWSNGGTGATITGLAPGNYTYNYTDGNSQNFTGTLTVNPAIPVLLSLSTVGISCAGVDDGQALASVTSGGITPYNYNWSGGQPNNPLANNLPPGNISVTVTDGANCTASASDIITGLPSLSLGVLTFYDSCYYSGKGRAVADISGGTPPYNYQWSNFVTDSANLNLVAGNYDLTVTDSKNCSVSAAGVVSGAPQLTYNDTLIHVLCKGQSTGTIALLVNGGTTPYNYTWSPSTASGGVAQNLPAGIYQFTVTDAYNCTFIGADTLLEPDSVLIASTTSTNVSCNGAADGTITINVSGGIVPYSFLGNPVPAGTTTLSGLSANTYSGNLIDSNGCTVALSETITEPGPQTLSITGTNNPCAGAADGTATATFTNPTGNVTYTWNPGGVLPGSISNLLSGTYAVTATDVNGCSAVDSIAITEPPAPVMAVTTIDALCFGGTGAVTANPSGGTGPYNYTWSNNAGNFQTINPLAGSYTVSASDAFSCNQTASFVINEPSAINITEQHTDVLCFGDATGDITLTVNGGTGTNYSFSWNPAVASGNQATSLIAGNYGVTVTDSVNCTTTSSIVVTEPAAPLSTSSQPQAVSCFGGSDGSITTNPTGGTSGYNFAWSPSVSSSNTANNLTAGSYDITISDLNNCTLLETVLVQEPSQLSGQSNATDASCNGYTDGSVIISATGGTPAYSYDFSTGEQNGTGLFSNLSAGQYSVTITDLENCSTTAAVSISEPDSVLITISPDPTTVQLGDNVQLQAITNQSGSLTYNWAPGNGLSCYDCSSPAFGGNYSTQYTVTVTTANGCMGSAAVTVTVIPNYDLFIPNAFSPNGDGANDEWMIYGNLPGIKQIQIMVFNRIGEKVFESTDINFKWDGTYKGTTAPPGVYVYVAEFVWINNHTDNQYRGSVTIVK
ncbi:MAG: gliding motility-associated C-terminal domain-containing protein [Bacteroidetes bacterium]|nr:gliding motility-associated C-terminal domain-containing protein [Bacteroidota bacterium]